MTTGGCLGDNKHLLQDNIKMGVIRSENL